VYIVVSQKKSQHKHSSHCHNFFLRIQNTSPEINELVIMVLSFLIPRNILKRQLAEYEEIQTIISLDVHAPVATNQMTENTRFLARRSPRIKSACPISDGETWMEIVVCNTPTGSRSLFYSLTSKQAKWDEPPSGASKIIYKDDVDAIAAKATTQFSIPSTFFKGINKGSLNGVTSSKSGNKNILSSKIPVSSSTSSNKNNLQPTIKALSSSAGSGVKTILPTIKEVTPSEIVKEERAKNKSATSESSNQSMLLATEVVTSSEISNDNMLPLVVGKREKEREVKATKKDHPSKQSKRLNDTSCALVKSPPKKLPTLKSEVKPKPCGIQPCNTISINVRREQDSNVHQDMSKVELPSTQVERSLEFIKHTIDFQLESMEKELLMYDNKERQPSMSSVMKSKFPIETEEDISAESSGGNGAPMAKHLYHRMTVDETDVKNEILKHNQKSDQGDHYASQQSSQGKITMQNRLQKMKVCLQAIEHSLLEAYNTSSNEQLPNNEYPTTKSSSMVFPKEGKLTLLEIARNSCTSPSISNEKMAADSPQKREMASSQVSDPLQQRRRVLEKNRERRLRQAGLMSRV
jgi:hypothetical protein